MKSTKSKIKKKTPLAGIHSRLNTEKEKESKINDIAIESIQNEAQKEKNGRKNELSINELCFKWHAIGAPDK